MNRSEGLDNTKINTYINKSKDYDSGFYYENGVNESNKHNQATQIPIDNINEYLRHRNDQILETGYDYNNEGILTKTLAGVFFIEPKRKAIINQFDKLFKFMANHVKSIKLTYNYILPKNYTKFN